MIVDEQIQSYRISFELTKPLQSGFVGTMKLIVNFLCQLRLDPELMECVHMNVWHQRRTANHNTEQVWLIIRNVSWAPNQLIRMISEQICDTEGWSNDC